MHIMPANVKTIHLNYVRMGNQQALLRIIQPMMVPLFLMQGNQVGDQLRAFPTKVMVRKLYLISSLLMKAKQEVKRQSTSNLKERELVLCPRVDLQLLAGLVLGLM